MLNPESPPALTASRWFNAEKPIALSDLKGKVVVVAAFQMHCPGSQKHGLPQAQRLANAFSSDEVAVIGLHSVFEDHDAQKPEALEAFLEEKGFDFPIAVDEANGGGLPRTFEAYELQGTPTVLVFDRQGRLRRHYLGQVDDVRLGAEVMALAIEARDAPREHSIAIERRLAATLTDPNEHHHHNGGCCGGHGHHHHDHDHDNGHHHHAHAEEGCCGGAGHGADCRGGNEHAQDHAHEKAPATKGKKTAKAGGCGNPECGCGH
jgi:peroxiredoxin